MSTVVDPGRANQAVVLPLDSPAIQRRLDHRVELCVFTAGKECMAIGQALPEHQCHLGVAVFVFFPSPQSLQSRSSATPSALVPY